MQQELDIDVVITWVDGNDPVLNGKRRSFLHGNAETGNDDIAGSTRYANVGEIHWCVRSINRFMPWVRRIFIVTDGQDPKVESGIPVEVVDHRVIFRGFEEFLPTFNSVSIEAMLWRIPGLSEHFVYFNDDLMVCRPVAREVFFPKVGHVNCHGHMAWLWWTKLRYAVKRATGHASRVNHIQQMMDAAVIAGERRRFVRLSHTPHPLLKSVMERFYTEHGEYLVQNIRNRFRSVEHFRNDELVYVLLRKEGRLNIVSEKKCLMEYMPTGGRRRLERKLGYVSQAGSEVMFVCFGSLDKASPEILERIRDFIRIWLA